MQVSRVVCSQHSSVCRCPSSSGLSSVPLESQQGAELPSLCKVCDFGAAPRDRSQKGSWKQSQSAKAFPVSGSPAANKPLWDLTWFPVQALLGPPLHSVTLGGWHCDRLGVLGIPYLHSRC